MAIGHVRAVVVVLLLVIGAACAAPAPPSPAPADSPSAIRLSSPPPTEATLVESPTPLPSLCPSPTLAPPAAVLDTAPGFITGYSWQNSSEGAEVTGLVPDPMRLTKPVQARADESLTVRVVGDCLVTQWSVRAYDPTSVEADGSYSGPVQELARASASAATHAVVFRAPEHDALVEVHLTFGWQGSGSYYWLVRIGEYR